MFRVPLAAAGLVLLAALPAVAQVPVPRQNPDASAADMRAIETLPHDEALKALGEGFGDSVRATQSDPSIPDILKALDANIAATRRVREMVAGDAAITDQTMAEIAREIGTVAKAFRDISDLAPGVFQRRLQELRNVDAIGAEAGFRIADARARLGELRQDNGDIQRSLEAKDLSRAELEKLRLTKQANDAEIHSLEAAGIAWSFFEERHAAVMDKLEDQSEDLDVFFHALRENARVYESAATTLNMANSVKMALKDLDTIQNLETLRTELVNSWGDLMKIVDEVNDGLMLQPGM